MQFVEDGTHTQLYAAGGLYRELYDLQFRAKEETQKAPAEAGA